MSPVSGLVVGAVAGVLLQPALRADPHLWWIVVGGSTWAIVSLCAVAFFTGADEEPGQ